MDNGQLLITDTNKSPLVQILVWVLLSTSVVTVLVRIATKAAYIRKLEVDDICILIALTLAIAQSIVVGLSTNKGFGKPEDSLSKSQVEAILKSQYAANMLDIAVLFLVKLSALSFIKSLTVIRLHHQLVTVLEAVILLWALSAEFSITFLCGLPSPWNYIHNACFDNRLTFWTYFGAMNITTEAGQILLILGIVLNLQTPRRRKITLCLVFGARTLVIAMVIIQLVLLDQASSQDPAFDLWPYVICTQAVECISFVTTCVPYLKPFLKSLESGLFRADDLHGFGTTMGSQGGMGTKVSKGSQGSKGKISSTVTTESTPGRTLELDALRSSKLPSNRPYTTITAARDENVWDRQSQSSQSRIISERRSWEVTVGVLGSHEA